MVQRNFVMLSSRGCTEQKRKQPLSCKSTEGQMPSAKNGRIFDASIIHCRIDLPTYWFTVVSSISVKNAELPMSNVLHVYRMTYKTYDMQEYIFVHPEERFARKPLFGIFVWLACVLSNGCKSLTSPNSGNRIANSKGVHREVESERSWRQTSDLTYRNFIQGIWPWMRLQDKSKSHSYSEWLV